MSASKSITSEPQNTHPFRALFNVQPPYPHPFHRVGFIRSTFRRHHQRATAAQSEGIQAAIQVSPLASVE